MLYGSYAMVIAAVACALLLTTVLLVAAAVRRGLLYARASSVWLRQVHAGKAPSRLLRTFSTQGGHGDAIELTSSSRHGGDPDTMPLRVGRLTATRRVGRSSVVAAALAVLLYAFVIVLPSAWWRDLRHDVWARLDSALLPGKRVLPVLIFGAIPATIGWLGVCFAPKRARPTAWPDVTRWRLSRFELVALLLWLLPVLAWWCFRLARYGGLEAEWLSLKHAAITFGLTAVLNLQVLLVPVAHSSPILALLGRPSDRLVGLHRALGKATVLFVLLHGGYFLCRWADERTLWRKLGEMGADDGGRWFSHVANLPGVVAAIAGLLIGLTSLPCVRRRAFEAFAYTHRLLAATFFVGAALHWSGFVYYTLPGAMLFLADAATHVTTRLRPRVRIHHARFGHGVLTLTLGCTAWLHAPLPLQWVLVQVPALSTLQWHAFSVAHVRAAAAGEPASFRLAIKVIDGGWTDALRLWLAAHSRGGGGGASSGSDGDDRSGEGSSSPELSAPAPPTLRVAGWYGLGYDVAACVHRGQPLICVCGGSGGVPCAALMCQLAEHSTPSHGSSSGPSMTMLWTCATQGQLLEYVHATDLLQTVERCKALRVQLHASRASISPRPSMAAQRDDAEPPANEPQREESAAGNRPDAIGAARSEWAVASHEAAVEDKDDGGGAFTLSFAATGADLKSSRWRAFAAPTIRTTPIVAPAAATKALASHEQARKKHADPTDDVTVGRSPAESGASACTSPMSPPHRLAVYCHVAVPLGVLAALACAEASMPGHQLALLVAVMAGAVAGALAALLLHSLPLPAILCSACRCMPRATRRAPAPPEERTEAEAPPAAAGGGGSPTATAAAGDVEVAMHEPASQLTPQIVWHSGRLDVADAVASAAQRVTSTSRGGAACAIVLASGPPGLVRSASQSAWRHGLAFERISFEL